MVKNPNKGKEKCSRRLLRHLTIGKKIRRGGLQARLMTFAVNQEIVGRIKQAGCFVAEKKSGRVDEANSIRMVADDFITWARTPPDSEVPEISGWATRLRRQKGLKNKCRHRPGGLPSSDDYGLRLSRLGGGGVFMRCKIILRPRRSSDHGFSHGEREQL